MRKRQIKKTIIKYQQSGQNEQEEQQKEEQRQRSRDKEINKESHQQPSVKIQEMNMTNRRARLQAMKKAQQQQQEQNYPEPATISVKIQEPINTSYNTKPDIIEEEPKPVKKEQKPPKIEKHSEQSEQQQQQQNQPHTDIIRKPVFIGKQYRENNDNNQQQLKQEERRKRNAKYTTKMLLQQQKYVDSEQQNENSDSQNDVKANAITDDDTIDQELQFQLWKIRQLNRIRRDRQERRKHELQKAQTDRRRTMTNEAILIENRALGSDSTDNSSQTKYVFMQKYYHRGAFYQDSQDQVFKRDYNLPTPMQMQDKSMLPAILQKRIGNFGKKGQSKYTHLTDQDTSQLNPLARPDQSLLQYWKKRTAGYKGSNKNV